VVGLRSCEAAAAIIERKRTAPETSSFDIRDISADPSGGMRRPPLRDTRSQGETASLTQKVFSYST
jgi:hypothetical protein